MASHDRRATLRWALSRASTCYHMIGHPGAEVGRVLVSLRGLLCVVPPAPSHRAHPGAQHGDHLPLCSQQKVCMHLEVLALPCEARRDFAP